MEDEVTAAAELQQLEPTSTVTVADLVSWYKESEHASDRWRRNARNWRKYYAGDQWTSEERAVLEKRGQPILTANMVAPKVNYLIGGEISSRIDPKAMPITPHEDDVADAITDALRVAAGRTQASFDQARTAVAGEMFVEGLSGAILGVDKASLTTGTPRFLLTHTPADRLFWDPHSRDPWFNDASYLGFATWMDLDAAKDKYQAKADVISGAVSAVSSSGDYHEDRPSAFWYDRKESRIKVLEVYWVEGGEWWFAHYVAAGSEALEGPRRVPYVDDQGKSWCPLIMVRGYLDEENDAYGIVKDLVSPQDALNKHKSKTLHAVNSNRILHECGALSPDAQTFAMEAAKPDGLLETRQGALTSGAVQIIKGNDLAQINIALIHEAKQDIETIGPTAQQLIDSGSSSGVSVARRKDIANIPIRPLFANLQEWTHDVFTGLWWLVRQFWTNEMWLRVTDDDDKHGYRFVGLNRRITYGQRVQELAAQGIGLPQAMSMAGLDDGTIAVLLGQAQQFAAQTVMSQLGVQSLAQVPDELRQKVEQSVQRIADEALLSSEVMAAPFIANNVSQVGVDIEISSTPDIGVVQQEQFEILADMAGKGVFNPAVMPPPVMRMLLKASQLRDKNKLLEELEDMATPKPDPAAEQAAQMQMQMQMQAMQIELQKTVAEVEQIKAQTAKTVAEIPKMEAAAQLDVARTVMQSITAGRESVPTMSQQGQP